MLSDSITKQLKNHFSIPLLSHQLEEHANRIIEITHFKSANSLLNNIRKKGLLISHTLKAQNGKNITLHCSQSLENLNPYKIAKALFLDSYFCNLTSIYYHSFTNQIPSSIYICHETISAKPKSSYSNKINNTSIRSAFIKPHRCTNYIFKFNQYEIIIVDRLKGSSHGVLDIHTSGSILPKHSRITSVERALIDAVVSPHYNGGIVSVYGYFKRAHQKINLTKLVETYRKLKFIYPYSQSIGFFLEKAGMTKHASAFLEEFPPEYSFFIDHDAKSFWRYDEKWKLYYPPGLINEN